MPTFLPPALRRLTLCAASLLCLGAGPVQAEQADRSKPMTIEADQPGSVDLQRQVVIFNGNVVISQGTMLLRAERVELRERADGYREAKAIGSAAQPASFRQKRDGVDETIEGSAERIEFDSRTDTLRLSGNATVRRLRSGVAADEISGSLITWDNTNELFRVTGGAATPSNPTGRVRAVLAPREAAAASAPPAGTASGAAGPLPLKPSRTLGVPR